MSEKILCKNCGRELVVAGRGLTRYYVHKDEQNSTCKNLEILFTNKKRLRRND